MNCLIAGCERPARSRHLCQTHYMRWIRTGSTNVHMAARGEGWTNALGYHLNYRTMTHIIVAERALGHKLPTRAVVHHVDEDPGNNRPDNLVICPSQGYHKLLHVRMRALKASGNPDFRMCAYCSQWDDPANMALHQAREPCNRYKHRACENAYNRARRAARRADVVA